MEMPGHEMPSTCKMSMSFNAHYKDLCILTSAWHIHNVPQLVLSIILLIAFCAGYEAYKSFFTIMDRRYSQLANSNVVTDKERKLFKFKLTLIYAGAIAYSMTVMLLFMSFNFWVMGSVVIGEAIGYWFWGEGTLGSLCH